MQVPARKDVVVALTGEESKVLIGVLERAAVARQSHRAVKETWLHGSWSYKYLPWYSCHSTLDCLLLRISIHVACHAILRILNSLDRIYGRSSLKMGPDWAQYPPAVECSTWQNYSSLTQSWKSTELEKSKELESDPDIVCHQNTILLVDH